jgi:hypothetical protein
MMPEVAANGQFSGLIDILVPFTTPNCWARRWASAALSLTRKLIIVIQLGYHV